MFKVLITIGIIFLIITIAICVVNLTVATIAWYLGLEKSWKEAVKKAFTKL